MAPCETPELDGGPYFVQSELHRASDRFPEAVSFQRPQALVKPLQRTGSNPKGLQKMTPTQQIIPGPRMPEGRNSVRSTAIELSRPGGSHRPQPEATVNYAAL